MSGRGDDHYSDMAQLGTPNHLENYEDEIPPFCSQSSISVADSFSEMSSQFDFFNSAPIQVFSHPSMKRHSSIEQPTTAGGGPVPFMLSPLNEFDEEYENPLNKAMILDHTATGFTWSKRRDEHNPLDLEPCCEEAEMGEDPPNLKQAQTTPLQQ